MGLRDKLFLWVFLLAVSMTALVSHISAQTVALDSDLDGLTDQAEIDTYHTDPHNPDTDGDGVDDGQEVLDGTDPLDPASNRIALLLQSEHLALDPSNGSLTWYIGRAAGILAFILLSFVVVNGLLISSRTGAKFIPPAVNLDMHRFASWLAIIFATLHFVVFIFDRYVKLTWIEALVPFVLKRPYPSALGFNLTAPVAFGVIGLYVMLVLIVTSEFRSKISARVWRKIHYASFAAYLLLVFHGLLAGTDSVYHWTRLLYAGSGLLVTLLVILRIRSAIRLKRMIAEAKRKRETVPASPPSSPVPPVRYL